MKPHSHPSLFLLSGWFLLPSTQFDLGVSPTGPEFLVTQGFGGLIWEGLSWQTRPWMSVNARVSLKGQWWSGCVLMINSHRLFSQSDFIKFKGFCSQLVLCDSRATVFLWQKLIDYLYKNKKDAWNYGNWKSSDLTMVSNRRASCLPNTFFPLGPRVTESIFYWPTYSNSYWERGFKNLKQ